ncbi:MAG TPA: competence/damage-inducible protein A [bacterium]
MSTSPTSSPRFRCELITVGDEVLRGDIVNGNAAYIGRALSAIGFPPSWSSVIADKMDVIKSALQTALSRAHVIVLTGGLGPTPDDLTRDAVAQFFDLPLQEDPVLLEHVEALFRSRGMVMPETSRNQSLFPIGASKLPNPHGTAAGIHIERDGRHVFCLPGVAIEAQQMTDESVVPIVREIFPDVQVFTKTLRLAGIGESHLMQQVGRQEEICAHVSVAYLPHHGLLDLRLTAHSTDRLEAEAQIAFAEAIIREHVWEHIYATGSAKLGAVIGNILINRGQKLAVAESCTGGLVSDMITDIPGSSRWFDRGWITYSNAAKTGNICVDEELIIRHGAVSEEVACAMAQGARTNAETSWGISTTGIAGPDGGTASKPVGTVWIAVSSESGAHARLLQLSGLRETIKLRTAHSVLYLLYRNLMGYTD